MENSYAFFSKMIGTVAVILLVAAYAGSTQFLNKYFNRQKSWKVTLLFGLLGGLFGVYGNISGIDLNGAVISVRDIGPMLSGLLGGPVCGLISGVIAGVHRLTMGGITANACVIATCLIGLLCGFISRRFPNATKKPYWVLLIGVVMESMHLGIVLLIVKPFSTAYDIVRQIAIPFISVNAVGIALMSSIIHYVQDQRAMTLERERMHSELEVANVIQHSLLPTLNQQYPGRPELDVSASMNAAKDVGGDFYDVFFVDSDRIAFLIGDVSGKGVPAALFMASSKTILQNCIRDIPVLADAMATANNVLCERNEAEMFVTVWTCILNLKNGHLTYMSAGHNHPVLVRDGTAQFIKEKNGFVLGGMENIKYKEHELDLKKGDTVFLYTDGVTEATTATNELFGDDRLLSCLAGSSAFDVHTILDGVKRSIDDFVQENEQFDDITMLCFKWK